VGGRQAAPRPPRAGRTAAAGSRPAPPPAPPRLRAPLPAGSCSVSAAGWARSGGGSAIAAIAAHRRRRLGYRPRRQRSAPPPHCPRAPWSASTWRKSLSGGQQGQQGREQRSRREGRGGSAPPRVPPEHHASGLRVRPEPGFAPGAGPGAREAGGSECMGSGVGSSVEWRRTFAAATPASAAIAARYPSRIVPGLRASLDGPPSLAPPSTLARSSYPSEARTELGRGFHSESFSAKLKCLLACTV